MIDEHAKDVVEAALSRRPVDGAIPPGHEQRRRLAQAARQYVQAKRLGVGLSVADLSAAAGEVLSQCGLATEYLRYASVLVANETQRDALAAVPFERRLLLLPQCLRSVDGCQARVDAYGLLCGQCGRCVIGDILEEAKRLGYVTMVAEGSALVTALIAAGRVEAMVGVSCLAMLEKVYPYVRAAGVPAVAIPLLSEGCERTHLDLDLLGEALHLSSHDSTQGMDMESLRTQVTQWFTPQSLEGIMGPVQSQTERIAREWIAKSGKRWRPFLAACAYRALDGQGPLGDDLRKVAVAVECFHKASLVHDDIEDDDDYRYGEKTLHAQYGVPVALNVGDFLLGEGYRLIGECSTPADRKALMMAIAARGHRSLALGQGAELCWMRDRRPMSCLEVLDIFRQKTAPAFDVALHLGAVCAGADGEISLALSPYSDCLGVAYQIHDDLEDFLGTSDTTVSDCHGDKHDLLAMRPSILLAIAYERADAAGKELLASAIAAQGPSPSQREQIETMLAKLAVEESARAMVDHYKDLAIRSLASLGQSHPPLEALLRRVMMRIFMSPQEMPCCDGAFVASPKAPAGPAADH